MLLHFSLSIIWANSPFSLCRLGLIKFHNWDESLMRNTVPFPPWEIPFSSEFSEPEIRCSAGAKSVPRLDLPVASLRQLIPVLYELSSLTKASWTYSDTNSVMALLFSAFLGVWCWVVLRDQFHTWWRCVWGKIKPALCGWTPGPHTLDFRVIQGTWISGLGYASHGP